MSRTCTVIVTALLVVGAARASQFWISWDEGWPDQEGWTEGWSGIPATKWLDASLLYIDSRTYGGADEYGAFPTTLIPGSQETFVMHWRVRVDASWPSSDPGVIVVADDHYALAFTLDTSSIHSNFESGKVAPFAPNEFHDFTVESSDMRAYDLHIDGSLALQGVFSQSFLSGPEIAWGDCSSGMSLAAWDTVEYGIVPEPSVPLCLLTALFCAVSLNRSATGVPMTLSRRIAT
jgi:hypothetical protein